MPAEAPAPLQTQPEITGDRYAWGKTGYTLCEKAYRDAWRDTKGPFIAVDLCSSTPMLAQIWREQHARACRGEARQGVVELAKVLDKAYDQSPFLSVRLMSSENKPAVTRLRKECLGKKTHGREVIKAIMQDMFANPRAFDLTGKDEEAGMRLKEYIFKQLLTSHKIYELRFEREEHVGHGRWQVMTEVLTGKTFKTEVDKVVGNQGDLITGQILNDVSSFLALYCLPRLREFKSFAAFSLDCEDPEVLMAKAPQSFPKDYWDTEFFKRIRTLGGNHIRADIMPRFSHEEAVLRRRKKLGDSAGLPFRFNSISLLTSIEGWPFYFPNKSKKYQFDVAQSIAEVLKPGGRFVTFSWETYSRDGDRQLLNQIERQVWQAHGLIPRKEFYKAWELIDKMKDREELLTHLSPVFRNPSATLAVLTLEKLVPIPEPPQREPYDITKSRGGHKSTHRVYTRKGYQGWESTPAA